MMVATEQKFRRQQQLFFGMCRTARSNFGLDPSWLKIYPYQIAARAGRAPELRDARAELQPVGR